MPSAETMENYDLVVIGAGIFGLPVAKTYLDIHPSSRVLMLDAGKSVGGTWAKERLYDDLYTNNLVGMLEFSDFPMDFETYGVPPGSHIPGAVVHRYLTDYAQHFGVFDNIQFNAWVKSAELKENGEWIISYDLNSGGGVKEMQLTSKKLVLATGTTSEPNMPSIAGSGEFDGDIFHSKELPDRMEDLSAAKNVVVYGGSKSAADAAYINASRGRHVDWVVRESGRGPAWLSYPHVSPFLLHFEKLATTRLMTFLGPSLDLDNYPMVRKFLHNTRIGRALVRGIFAVIHGDLISRGKFNDHPDTKKLIPTANIYWYGSAVGIFNYPTDLFGYVKQGLINIHTGDITSLSSHTVHLSNGKDLNSDVLVCATGYKSTPTVSFLPENISNKIGISTAPPSDPAVQAADKELMKRFPGLKDQPPAGQVGEKEREQTSSLLYRGTVPPAFLQSRNLAYCGLTIGLRGMLIAELHALWITAFFDGTVTLPSDAEAEWEAMLRNRFARWRAPNGIGPRGPDMIFEMMPFFDTIMRDLGLNPARKGGWREIFEWYGSGDYKGIVPEYLSKENQTSK